MYANDYTLELSCEVAAPRSGQSLRRLGVPPWEAKRNEIKSEEETIMVNEAVIKESIVVNETMPV